MKNHQTFQVIRPMTRKSETFGPGELVNLSSAVAEALIAAGVVEKPQTRWGEPKSTPVAVAKLATDDES